MLNFVCYIALSVTFNYSSFMQCRPNAELCLLHWKSDGETGPDISFKEDSSGQLERDQE